MTDGAEHVTARVRRQYEQLPYPPRDPRDERKRLVRSVLDNLAIVNHYCFRGRQSFRDHFRALVAGGGTGDTAIYLAQRLRSTNAEVHYLDVSEASKEIARRRARVRGLGNIVWHSGSLLDLPGMGLPKFDYVNCAGVLHHLASPERGLAALRAVLKDDGAMGLLVYGQYGRTGVYQLQELLRRINRGIDDTARKLANAKAALASLPPTNWFKRGEDLHSDHVRYGDAGIYDLLLHSQDRAYTVEQLHGLLEGVGLHLIEYSPRARADYRPETWLAEGELPLRLAAMPRPRREAVAELISGALFKHSFHASPREDTVARLEELDNVPFLRGAVSRAGGRIADVLAKAGGAAVNVQIDEACTIPLPGGRCSELFFRHLDGRATVGEILQAVRRQAGSVMEERQALAAIRPAYEAMNARDLLLLRHRCVPAMED